MMTPWPQDLPIHFDLKSTRWADAVLEMEPVLVEALRRIRKEKWEHRRFAIYRWFTRPKAWYANWRYKKTRTRRKRQPANPG